MIRAVVDHESFKRPEEQARGVADTRGTPSLVAHDAPKLLEDDVCASSPRSRLRSNSPTNRARAGGESSRR
jgi:hypothetical protein